MVNRYTYCCLFYNMSRNGEKTGKKQWMNRIIRYEKGDVPYE